MPRPLSQADFRSMLEDPSVPEEQIAEYLRPNKATAASIRL